MRCLWLVHVFGLMLAAGCGTTDDSGDSRGETSATSSPGGDDDGGSAEGTSGLAADEGSGTGQPGSGLAGSSLTSGSSAGDDTAGIACEYVEIERGGCPVGTVQCHEVGPSYNCSPAETAEQCCAPCDSIDCQGG